MAKKNRNTLIEKKEWGDEKHFQCIGYMEPELHYERLTSSFMDLKVLYLFIFNGLTINASATISDISETMVSDTEEKVFLHRGQAVARISGFPLVSSAAASDAIFFLLPDCIFMLARLPPQHSDFSSSKSVSTSFAT